MCPKVIFGHPKWGGGAVNHSGIYTVFALGQIHQFFFFLSILEIVGIFIIIRLHCSWVSRLPAGRAS